MNKEDFLKIKEAYKSARTEEKKRIKDFLLSKRDSDGNLIFLREKDATDTFVRTGGGYGKKHYSSGGTLSRPYDLSNHMWIDLKYKGNDILISLQSFDIDPNENKNLHVLYDRIGILFEKATKFCCQIINLKSVMLFLKWKQQTGNYLYLKQRWRKW